MGVRVERAAEVLIVDDDADIRAALADVLEEEGWTSAEAVDGLHAKELLEAGLRPRVMLLDLMMPRLTGQELLAWLRRSDEPLRNLPVVVLTASTNRPVAEAQAVLNKPVSMAVLLAELERCCRDEGSSAEGATPA